MADTAISGLSAGTVPVSGNVLPIVQAGTTYKIDPTTYLYFGTTSSVSGTDFSTSSTTLVNITGLTFAAGASGLYEVQAMLLGQAASGGMQASVGFSAAGATGSYFTFAPSTTAASSGGTNAINTALGVAIWTTATTDLHAFIRAMVKTGVNAGNITIQILKVSSGTVTVYKGSSMIVTQRA